MKFTIRRFISFSFFILISIITWAQHPCALAKQESFQQQLKKGNANSLQMDLMELYDVHFHHLNLGVERTTKYIQGSVRTKAIWRTNETDTFGFQLHSNFTIDSILDYASGSKLTFSHVADFCYAQTGNGGNKGSEIDLQIFYKGTAPTSGSAAIGDGFSNKNSPTYGNQITWSLSQPYSAYEWWPCKQSLQDKIDSVFTSITTDTSNKAGGCGLLNLLEPSAISGKHTFHWKTFYPIDYYLIMVSVGKYTEYVAYAKPKGLADSILVQHYIYNNPTAYTQNLSSINSTVPLIEKFSDLFGLYPFHAEKYGHVMAPFSGGMEHQTMTTLGIFNFGLVAHELGHQWFGDHVTCATWKDIWLNEGMATYLEYLAAKYLKTASVAENEIITMHAEAKKGTGSVYCYDTTSVSRIFSSAITYNKGGSAVRVLHYLLGDSMFFHVLKTYQSRFAFRTASTNDFRLLVNEVSGRNLDYFFENWIYKGGWPTYVSKWNQRDSMLYLQIGQTNYEVPSNLFDLMLPYKITFKAGGDTIIYVRQNNELTYFSIKINQPIQSIVLDPESWILKNSTVQFDATINSIEDPYQPSTFTIYPNPTSEKLLIGSNRNGIFSYKIFDLMGKLLQSGLVENNGSIDITALKEGCFLFQLEMENNQSQSRIFTIMH